MEAQQGRVGAPAAHALFQWLHIGRVQARVCCCGCACLSEGCRMLAAWLIVSSRRSGWGALAPCASLSECHMPDAWLEFSDPINGHQIGR
jgi:hypothetical protein